MIGRGLKNFLFVPLYCHGNFNICEEKTNENYKHRRKW
jgi:hypothetical protein